MTFSCSFTTPATSAVAPFGLSPAELVEELGRRVPAALAVLDRDAEALTLLAPVGERRACLLHTQRHVAADERERRVRAQHAREEAGLAEDLEAVADPQHRPAFGRERRHRAHHRREARDRPAPEVVAVREAAGQDDRAGVGRQALVGVPDEPRVGPERSKGPGGIAVVVRPGEDDDGDRRAGLPLGHRSASSIS
jgi:hypothetical protein